MSSSHQLILTSSPDGPITAHDPSTHSPLSHFTGSRSPRRGLTLAGKTFIAASHISPSNASCSIHLYNWWAPSFFHNLPLPEPVAPLASTHDGLFLFAGGISGNIHSIPVPSGNILKSFSAHDKPVSCLRMNHDGSLLISGSDNGTIVVTPIFKLLDAEENENESEFALCKFLAHDDSVTDIGLMGLCNSEIISCSLDCTCKIWSLLNGTNLRTVMFPCGIFGLVLNPSEFDQFYAAGSDGWVYKSSLKNKNNQVVSIGENHDGAVMNVIMVDEGRSLVSASENGNVWTWECLDGGKVIRKLRNEMGSMISDMVLVKGMSYGKLNNGLRMEINGGSECENQSFGVLGSGILSGGIKERIEVEDVLEIAKEDKRKAIEMLESAIDMYERLLEFILKEAQAGLRNSSDKREG